MSGSTLAGPPSGWQVVGSVPVSAPPPAPVDLPAWAGGAGPPGSAATSAGGKGAPPAGWEIVDEGAAGPGSAPSSTLGGVVRNFAAGANQMIAGTLGLPMDISSGIRNLAARGINAIAGTQIPQATGAPGTTQWIEQHMPAVGLQNPAAVPTHGEPERMARAAGGVVASLPMMGAGGAALEAGAPAMAAAAPEAAVPTITVLGRAAGQAGRLAGTSFPSMLAPIAPAAAGGAVGERFADAVPPAYAPLANLAGNLVGGGLVAGVQGLVGAGARSTLGLAGRMGAPLIPKEPVDVPGGAPISATASQIGAAGQRIAAAGGEPLRQALAADPLQDALDDLTARMASPEAQGDPALQAELQGRITAVQSAIASRGSRYETFPGENPMTAQLAPTAAMIGGFRAAMSASPDLAEAAGARTAQQNAARLAQIAAMAPAGASPDALGDFFVNGLQNLDQQAAATEERLRPSVQAATETLGGQQAPQQLGEQMTAAVEEQRQPFIAARRALWQAVDPDGNWALPAPTTRQAASDTLGMMTAGAQERMSGVEKSLLNEAATLSPVVRFAELGQLRQDVNAGIRQIGGAEGWQSPGVMRLQRLKSGIDDDIAEAVNQRGVQEQNAVLAGTMAAEDTMLARLGGDRDAWLRQRQSAGTPGMAPWSGGEENTGYYGAAGSRAPSGVSGTAGAPPRQLGGYPGTPRLPGQISAPLTPNFPPDAADRYAAAVAKTRAEKERFGQGVTGQILRAGRNGAPFAMLRSDVPGAVVSGGASQAADLANYLRATGASPAGLRTAQDAVVARLRASGAINPDGIVDTAKLDKWAAKNSETIALVPGLKAALGNARAAQSALDRATTESRAAVKAFRDGIAKSFLGGRDPAAAVAEALAGRNSAENLDQLITAAHGNDDATRSLQGRVVDFLVNRFSTEGPSSGIGEAAAEGRVLKGAALSKWIADNKAPLKRLFGGQGVQNFEMVTARLRQGAARIPAGTARSAAAHGHGTPFLLFVGEVLGEHAGGHGLAGMAATYLGKTVLDRMRAAGLKTINDLVSEAYLHPEVAKALLAKVGPGGTVSTLAAKRIGVTLQAALLADTIGNANGRQTQ